LNEEIKSLVDSLRRGQYENPAEKIGVLAAALREHNADAPFLLTLLRAPQISLRLAALEACRGRLDDSLVIEVASLAADLESRVRLKVAEVLATLPERAAAGALKSLADDADDEVRSTALKSTAGKPAFLELQRKALANDADYEVRVAAASALGEQKIPTVAKDLLIALATDSDDDVQRRCAECLEKRLTQTKQATEKHLPTDIALLSKAERAVKSLVAARFPNLLEWLRERTTIQVDPQQLARFGSDLTAQAAAGTLPRGYGAEEVCTHLVSMVQRDNWRSIALIGESGVGKSAIVNELVHRLARPENGGWRVLRMSPTDFMAGTHYIGEWETKVRELVEAVRKPRRVVIYVPNLSDLSAVGRWSKSDSNVATALSPYVEDGSILLLGESTPAEFERGLGAVPSLKRLFDVTLIKEASLEETRQILDCIRKETNTSITDTVLSQLLDLASQFLSHQARPGNAALLLRQVIAARDQAELPISMADVLATLSKSTGLPTQLMDDSVPLQIEEIRRFFDQRIIGQPEAVEAVVDLVTLIKAGLTDPGKPFAVFLFIGPTGVGKTELARALAEFIFGDPARLLRFDMSEYSSPAGFERLIGGKNENGLLTDAVRQKPFSVILFDEIEKSHLNVFDLCLQIFDAGRLTDGRGRTVNFRRSILILTSNIGAEGPTATLGFNATSPPPVAGSDRDRTFRELSRFFRPEFLNRIDRIVNFRALTLEVAERIARREIELVLQRQGFARRQLTIDIDPSVVALLVKEGYSPHFGARPLKRTVERLCLLPLARAIATGRITDKTVLYLAQQNGKVEVQLPRAVAAKAPTTSRAANEARGEIAGELQRRFEDLQSHVQPLADRKSELLRRTQLPGFYHDQRTRDVTFDEIHKLDQFLQWRERVGRALEKLQQRAQRKSLTNLEQAALSEHLEELSAELGRLHFVTTCRDLRDLSDALVSISLVERQGDAQSGVEKLARMYLALAGRRGNTVEVLGELFDAKADRAWIQISGLGSFALLKGESGLHRIDHRYRSRAARTGREKERQDREIIRIDVLPVTADADCLAPASWKTTVQTLKPAQRRLIDKADWAVSIFDERSLRSLELWTAGPKERATATAARILHSQVQSPDEAISSSRQLLVREYELGIGSRIKDFRTGKTTTQVDKIFKGQIDFLLVPAPATSEPPR
jgi:ATP-dependent Clp protease ATP-binding subunit ClpC